MYAFNIKHVILFFLWNAATIVVFLNLAFRRISHLGESSLAMIGRDVAVIYVVILALQVLVNMTVFRFLLMKNLKEAINVSLRLSKWTFFIVILAIFMDLIMLFALNNK